MKKMGLFLSVFFAVATITASCTRGTDSDAVSETRVAPVGVSSAEIKAEDVSESTIAVTIVGEVNNEGNFLLPKDSTILDALKRANGFTRAGAANRVTVQRIETDGSKYEQSVNVMRMIDGVSLPFPLNDGDVIIVPSRIF